MPEQALDSNPISAAAGCRDRTTTSQDNMSCPLSNTQIEVAKLLGRILADQWREANRSFAPTTDEFVDKK